MKLTRPQARLLLGALHLAIDDRVCLIQAYSPEAWCGKRDKESQRVVDSAEALIRRYRRLQIKLRTFTQGQEKLK